MEVFRITKEVYSSRLTASGSANRWNKRGQNVIYAGSSSSLSTLELVVHRSAIIPADIYKVAVISIADNDKHFKQVFVSDLPEKWRSLAAYSKLQEIGAKWYNNQETLVLRVPSAVIPFEYNYIINTEHPDFTRKINLVRLENYFWDDRLL
jgi:RES domain-containing protein